MEHVPYSTKPKSITFNLNKKYGVLFNHVACCRKQVLEGPEAQIIHIKISKSMMYEGQQIMSCHLNVMPGNYDDDATMRAMRQTFVLTTATVIAVD
jgi:hypothetical protein